MFHLLEPCIQACATQLRAPVLPEVLGEDAEEGTGRLSNVQGTVCVARQSRLGVHFFFIVINFGRLKHVLNRECGLGVA